MEKKVPEGTKKRKKKYWTCLRWINAKTIQTRERSPDPGWGTESVNKESIRHP